MTATRTLAHRRGLRAAALVVAAAAAVVAGSGSCAGRAGRSDVIRFVDVAPGIAHTRFEVKPKDRDPFSGHAFRIDLDVADLHLVAAGSASSRRIVDEIARAHPSVVATNASFFDEEGRAMGIAVDDGRLLAMNKLDAWGALVVDGPKGKAQARVIKGAEIGDELSHRLVVQGLPRLVVKGQVQKLKDQVAARTAICAQAGVVVLVVSTAAETEDFAHFLAAPADQGGLGCVDALNLDGGPSTQLYARLPGVQARVAGGWGVPNALVALPGGASAPVTRP